MINSKGLYAIKAVLELSKLSPGSSLTISQIATRRSIPPRFLESILRELSRARICRATRGRDGGYALNHNPQEITLGDVMRIFEPSLLGGNNSRISLQEDITLSVLRNIFDRGMVAMFDVFDSYNFQTLCEMENKDLQVQDYVI